VACSSNEVDKAQLTSQPERTLVQFLMTPAHWQNVDVAAHYHDSCPVKCSRVLVFSCSLREADAANAVSSSASAFHCNSTLCLGGVICVRLAMILSAFPLAFSLQTLAADAPLPYGPHVLTDNKQTPWPLVCERTIPTERPPLADAI
jgi:hypothetical protein